MRPVMDGTIEDPVIVPAVHAALPEAGMRIGICAMGVVWLPFEVVRYAPGRVLCRSPFHPRTTLFAFWLVNPLLWQPWDNCPALREPCTPCHGTGMVKSKKKDETMRACRPCHGHGEVARDDPFARSHRV